LEQIAAYTEIFLNTGHVSPAEAFRLIDLSREFGIKKVLIANSVVANMTIDEMKRAAASGAYLERTLAAHTHTTSIPKTHYYVEPEWKALDEGLPGQITGGVKMIADQIQEVGARHFILATDFGVYTLPSPVEGMREFIASMLDAELGEADIRMMTSTNPARLLGLE
jgi:microsomal dipeptidase-like Zn-dependent dipeptidase